MQEGSAVNTSAHQEQMNGCLQTSEEGVIYP
jgi:hypothetical protein